jgi:hypothetical protein
MEWIIVDSFTIWWAIRLNRSQLSTKAANFLSMGTAQLSLLEV